MKNLKSTKFIILLTALAFLFGGIGVSLAQLDTTSSESMLGIDEKDTNIIGASIVLTEELNTIEKSIEKTSEQIDFIDENVITQEEQVAIEKKVNTRIENLGVTSENDAQIQMGELLRIIREKDIPRVQNIQETKLEKSKILLENKKQREEDGLETEIDTETDTNIDNEEVIKDLEKIEIATKEDTQALEEIVLEKKRKIINRASNTKKPLEDTLKDSDNDGISDFDEISIYETDPFSADSDGDGYIDGVEVLSGFNPKDSSNDAVVVYENPKESGALEEDLFSVAKIEVITKTESSASNIQEPESIGKMLFEGQSLPNSFVTLYIFSIPTVVTVKTDDDGNWSYTMDKELENGEHEIYVAMTDNSGKIITKSKPIPFVKEAFAVTVDDGLLLPQITGNKPSFLNLEYLYLTILILVFLLGVILTIIGIRLNLRKEEGAEDEY